jgi:hypothetical protein
MGIKICDWWMSLLQHSCCKTHIFTKTFEATFMLQHKRSSCLSCAAAVQLQSVLHGCAVSE